MKPRLPKPQQHLQVEYVCTSSLEPDPRNARTHSKRQIAKLTNIVREFGFTSPILIDEGGTILAGHARLAAANAGGMTKVPCIRLTHLTKEQKIALAIADNKMSDESQFDVGALRTLLGELDAIDFKIELTGFDTAEVDIMLTAPSIGTTDPADAVLEGNVATTPITRTGDLWLLGKHRLLCGSALSAWDYKILLGAEKAEMIFSDPPYNLAVSQVSGLGKTKHAEFAMATGELSTNAFVRFLDQSMVHLCSFSTDGCIHFLCMDWRHIWEMMEAGKASYTELKAVCVWNKTNGGMGSLYRSKHEFVFVFKNGSSPHVNNIELGRTGRYRTNVWDYAGVNTFRAGRDEDLATHPTVKPVTLVADAIRDCSRRGALVLDPFMGSVDSITQYLLWARDRRNFIFEAEFFHDEVPTAHEIMGMMRGLRPRW